MMRRNCRLPYGIAGAAAALLLLSFFSIRYGSTPMPAEDFFAALTGASGYETQRVILYAVRIPRLLAGICAGAGLSVSGLLLQQLTGNALAGPNIIGVNAGAGFACVLLLSYAPAAAANAAVLPIGAFAGAFAATLLIAALSRQMQSAGVDLAGIAVTAILNAGISFLTLLDADVLSSYNAFSVGGFAGVGMEELCFPAAVIVCAAAAAALTSRHTALLALGDDAAVMLGVPVARTRLIGILCASASAAAAVSFAGLLGFVGLIVPHMARRITGHDSGAGLLLMCMLLGGAVSVAGDFLGRIIAAPTEIPVGIMMALVGGPFFLYLLMHRGRQSSEN